MKTLALPTYQSFLNRKNQLPKNDHPIDEQTITTEKDTDRPPKKNSLFNPESPENLTLKECIIRGAFVMILPMLSTINWTYETYTLILIIPTIFYLEVTAFTMNCPIKALFSNYSHPSKFE